MFDMVDEKGNTVLHHILTKRYEPWRKKNISNTWILNYDECLETLVTGAQSNKTVRDELQRILTKRSLWKDKTSFEMVVHHKWNPDAFFSIMNLGAKFDVEDKSGKVNNLNVQKYNYVANFHD